MSFYCNSCYCRNREYYNAQYGLGCNRRCCGCNNNYLQGARGARGVQGPPFASDYVNAYSLVAQTVATGVPFTFGTVSASSNLPATSTSEFTIQRNGTYSADYAVYPDATTAGTGATIALYRNGAPIAGSVVQGTDSLRGSVIFTANTGDIITLQNAGTADITTITPTGGAVANSIKIMRIA